MQAHQAMQRKSPRLNEDANFKRLESIVATGRLIKSYRAELERLEALHAGRRQKVAEALARAQSEMDALTEAAGLAS